MNNSNALLWSKIILSLNLRMRSPETFLFQQQSLVQETVFVPELSFVYFPFSAVFSNFHISVRPRCYYFMPHKSARMNAHSFFSVKHVNFLDFCFNWIKYFDDIALDAMWPLSKLKVKLSIQWKYNGNSFIEPEQYISARITD